MRRGALAGILLATAACASAPLPESPPLADLEEPPALLEEPDDEAARAALPAGSFSGIHVGDARSSLEALLGEPEGVVVASVVENSPADAAGILEGDLILAAAVLAEGAPESAATEAPVAWPSEWRELELATPPGTRVHVLIDRAGAERAATLVLAERVHGAPREEGERLREEARVGVVVRTATEAEARAAGLGPGGGAVVVGLSRSSPWRPAGVRYGDLVLSVDGRPVAHPLVLLDAIRSAPDDGVLALEVARDTGATRIDAPVSRRASEVHRVKIPLLYSYERDRGRTEWSALLGLVQRESTQAAWNLRLLWLFRFSGGDADRLEEVDR